MRLVALVVGVLGCAAAVGCGAPPGHGHHYITDHYHFERRPP